ncbi:hypothetical protein XH80_05860 [Bradyrhizobium sp. CCBAU 45384]|nr:hypothetical protein [Bradyrhizobium sp. CCBAU 45384]
MNLLLRLRAAFSVGSMTDPLGRSLLVEQFRVLRKQVPVLYAVLLIDSISVGLVLPSSVSPWLRFAVPAALLAICMVRLVRWVRLDRAEFTPEQAYLSWREPVSSRSSSTPASCSGSWRSSAS